MEDFKWIKYNKSHEDIIKSLEGKSYDEKIYIAIKNESEWLFDYVYDENHPLTIRSCINHNSDSVFITYSIISSDNYANERYVWVSQKYGYFLSKIKK